MNDKNMIIGIDKRDDIYYVARVDYQTGRADVKALIRFDVENFNGHHLLEGDKIIVSCPDNQTMLKQIQLPNSENSQLNIQFELETSLADNVDNYLFDSVPTKIENYYLGLIIHKKLIHKQIKPFIKQNGNYSFSTGGVMRAVALAHGFLTFCHQSGGELSAIIDFGNQTASIAIFYKHEIIEVTELPISGSYNTSESSFQKMIIELKTLLNFKIASLLELGISVPLSILFLIGNSLNKNQLQLLEDTLKIEIAFPKIHSRFISDQSKNDTIQLDKYLIALGLTVI